MADIILTNANTAGFIPSVWAMRALDVLRSNMVMTKLVARDTKFEPGWQGQTLNIPYPGTFTAALKTEGTPVSLSVPTGSTVSVSLNKHAYVDFVVEDYANAQANMNLLDRYVRPAAIALGNKVEDDIFALYTSLTGTSVGTSGTDIAAATVRSAVKALDDAFAPVDQQRNLVIASKDRIALLGDSNLASYFAFSQSQAVSQGKLGELYGMNVFMSQRVPVVAGAPNSTKNLAFVEDAMILAVRPFRDLPPGSGVQAATVVDPETGMSIRVLYQYDIANRGVHVAMDILYGTTVLRPTLGSVVLS